jgi:hypothetical protein
MGNGSAKCLSFDPRIEIEDQKTRRLGVGSRARERDVG